MDKSKQLEILKNIINIKTVNDNEGELADYLASLFAPYPDQVKLEKVNYGPGRDNLVVTIGHGGKILGYSGHMDVVDPGDLDSWDSDPFQAVVKDNKLYGRGASDMKSGLAAIVVTALEFLENGQALPGTLKLLLTVGEELGNMGAHQLTVEGYADDLDGLVIAEPNNDMHQICYATKGVVDYHVTSYGKAAHSSQPENGVNAIDNLLTFIHLAEEKLAQMDQVDPVLGPLTHVVSKIQGGEQINSVPDKAQMAGNIRTIPQYPNQFIYDTLGGIIEELNQQDGYQLSINYTFPEEPMGGDAQSELLKLAQTVAQNTLGFTPEPEAGSGANDAQEFTQAKKDFTAILIGPGGSTSHQPNECVNLDAYYGSINFFKQFALAFWK